jgi:hypothetical protein
MNLKYHEHIGGGSHLPILMKLVGMTDGPILELGMGLFSTPYLHWACYDKQRKLVSYDTNKEFMNLFKYDDPREAKNKYGYHERILVKNKNWDAEDLLSIHWSIVLVDHHPGPRRKEEVRRLADNADYIVVHDTNGRNNFYYKFTEVYPLFKYRYDYAKCYPFTTVLSNFKDLKNL